MSTFVRDAPGSICGNAKTEHVQQIVSRSLSVSKVVEPHSFVDAEFSRVILLEFR